MEIKQAIEFSDNIRDKISDLYVEAFFDIALKHFSNDKDKLKKAFAPMFLLEYFYVAVIDNEIIGMTACMDKGNFCLNIDKKIFVKHLGVFKGLFAYFANKNYIKKFAATIEIDKETAIIEYVATDTKYRGKGVASTIMKYIFTSTEFKHYVLEVADTNVNAFELYKKLGYKELYRKKFMPGSGINFFIYMKYSKE